MGYEGTVHNGWHVGFLYMGDGDERGYELLLAGGREDEPCFWPALNRAVACVFRGGMEMFDTDT